MAFFGTTYYILVTLAVISTLILMFALYDSSTDERVKLPLIAYFAIVCAVPIPYLNVIPTFILIGYMGKDTYIAVKSKYFAKLIESLTTDY